MRSTGTWMVTVFPHSIWKPLVLVEHSDSGNRTSFILQKFELIRCRHVWEMQHLMTLRVSGSSFAVICAISVDPLHRTTSGFTKFPLETSDINVKWRRACFHSFLAHFGLETGDKLRFKEMHLSADSKCRVLALLCCYSNDFGDGRWSGWYSR